MTSSSSHLQAHDIRRELPEWPRESEGGAIRAQHWSPTHYVRWKKYRPDLYGRACVVFARGRGRGPRNLGLLFEDGERVVMPRFAVRELPV